MNGTINRKFNAAIYLRISKEDGDFSISGKYESESITSQRAIIEEFVANCPDITIKGEWMDDGYTGTNFERPGFTKMMEAVRKGEINCIIVKDLSRFGREYIESGRYIERIFPQLGVRFIAVNDNYDSLGEMGSAETFVLPFKNLINDSYCRDISAKVRSALEASRKKGEFVANYAVYGYQRNPDNKNQLLIDEEAAVVVREIYRYFVLGMRTQRIAEHLNRTGVLSPMDYKKAKGINYQTPFRFKQQSQWSAVAVQRILKNPIYAGILVQGKRTTPNYKVHKSILKKAEDWAIIENSHEPIVSKETFDLVQQLFEEDVRTAPKQKEVYPFSGRIFCGDCHNTMVRKVSKRCGREYIYYVCSANKADRSVCSKHSIREDDLMLAVTETMKSQIETILNIDKTLDALDRQSWERHETEKIQALIHLSEVEVEKNSGFLLGLYEDLKDGVINKEEYNMLKPQFADRVIQSRATISELEEQLKNVHMALGKQKWLDQLAQYQNITGITRQMVVELIKRIDVFENGSIEIIFNFENEMDSMLKFVNQKAG